MIVLMVELMAGYVYISHKMVQLSHPARIIKKYMVIVYVVLNLTQLSDRYNYISITKSIKYAPYL